MARGAASLTGARRGLRNPWLLAHLRALRDGWSQLVANVLPTGVSVAVMAIAIGLPATLFALLDNQRALFSEWGSQPTLSVFLAHGSPEGEALRIAGEWRKQEQIDAVEVIFASKALAQFSAATGFSQGSDDAPNPLPNVLIVTPDPLTWNHRGDGELLKFLRAEPLVDSVLVDFEWIERLRSFSALAERGVWILGVTLLLTIVLVIGNTVRLLVQEQLAEIEVLKLVGATDAFVRRPFLYSGAIHGLLAGILAAAMLEVVFAVLAGPVADLASAYVSEFRLDSPGSGYLADLIALSATIGWLGAWLGTLRTLHQFEPVTE
jgi:cell division transport system permease protein